MTRILKLAILLLLCSPALQAQVPVSMAPVTKFQFLGNSGLPLASGCLFTYQSGTTNPAVTYIDSTGTSTNTNPIILDSAGRADIWIPNAAFKFKLVTFGGVNCASGSTLWTVDNITGVLGLLNLSNTWTGVNTFSQPVVITPNSNQIVLGANGFQTTLNAPAPAGNITINFPTVADTLVGLTASQTLTNKTLTAPIITLPSINGVTVTGTPGTYVTFPNNPVIGTFINSPVTFAAAVSPSSALATSTPNATSGGAIGICVSGCGTAGTATIQQTGNASCVFDGATGVNDYVQISATVNYQCHDAGQIYPVSGQVLGRVLSSNGGGGTYLMTLFGPEQKVLTSGSTVGCTNFTPVTVTNNNASQNLMSCTIPANTLVQGSLLEVDVTGIESTASNQTITLTASLGGGTACQTTGGNVGVSNNQPFNYVGKFFVLTSGAGGTANWSCESFFTGIVTGPFGTVGAPTISINTTISNVLQITVQMSVANAGNSTTEQGLKAVVF